MKSVMMSESGSAPAAVTRFAPSPTGYLHLGHAYSALFAHGCARGAGGRFLLRLEDIDGGRCRPEYDAAILEDLAWLGLRWDGPVRRQSQHLDDYRAVLDRLDGRGLLYPCFCTRREIQEEVARAPQAPHGPDGVLYPGTCRRCSTSERQRRIAAGESHCLRLDMAAAVVQAGPLRWHDVPPAGRRRARRFSAISSWPARIPRRATIWRSPGMMPSRASRWSPAAPTCSSRPTSIGCCRRCLTCRCRTITTIRCAPTNTAAASPSATAVLRCGRCERRGGRRPR